jgi:hypothetical protein
MLKDLDKYLNNLRNKNKYDPRNDLTQDSNLWQWVLKVAEKYDKKVFGTLHGFRCLGCQLSLNKKNHLVLNPSKECNNKEWFEYRQEWLIPITQDIKNIFSKVESYINKKNENEVNDFE